MIRTAGQVILAGSVYQNYLGRLSAGNAGLGGVGALAVGDEAVGIDYRAGRLEDQE